MACRQLGLPGGAAREAGAYASAYAISGAGGEQSGDSQEGGGEGKTTGGRGKKGAKKEEEPAGPPPVLANLRCTGAEPSLSACSFDAAAGSACGAGLEGRLAVACG